MARKISAVLIDLSGTIHIENAATPGAIESLIRLRKEKIKLKFVTNTTKESKGNLIDRLLRIGFDISNDEVFTSLTAARHLITTTNLRPFYMLSDSALEDFSSINNEDPNAVLIGLSPQSFHYDKLNEAFRLIIDGAKLIAIHKAKYYKKNDGLALGPGAFITGLEYASGVKAECVGKPEKSFFMAALNDLNCSPSEAVMIGDDAGDDIKGAIDCGLLGILVKTGKYRDGDETKFYPAPTEVCANFSDAVDLLINQYIDK